MNDKPLGLYRALLTAPATPLGTLPRAPAPATAPLVMALMALAAFALMSTRLAPDILGLALAGGFAGFLATSLGALAAFSLRGLSQAAEDGLLAFSAGMMLAASAFSLILPALESAALQVSSEQIASALVVLGLGLGVATLLVLESVTPHAHRHSGEQGPASGRIRGVWLFVFAIVLHNLPEGMAIGTSLSAGDLTVGLPLTAAIALQDVPEGLAVAMSLRATGLSPSRAVAVAVGSGLMEPLGAVLGAGMVATLPLAYPVGLAAAAGAMLFVVSHEVIPETHRNGHQRTAMLALMGAFALMMFLDTALG